MLRVPLWERMILQRLLQADLALLTILGALLIILDFGLQASTLLKEVGWGGLAFHYLLVISKRLPLLVSLAAAISCVQVAHQLVRFREWLALQAGGISRWRLCRPFSLFALAQALLLAANAQWLQPQAVDQLDSLEGPRSLRMSALASTKNGPLTLICHQLQQRQLEEVYWVSPSQIEWARHFDLETGTPTGLVVMEKRSTGWHRVLPSQAKLYPLTPREPFWRSAPWAETQPLLSLCQMVWDSHPSPKVQAITLQRLLVCLLPACGMAASLPSLLRYRRQSNWMGSLLLALAVILGGFSLLEAAGVLVTFGAVSPWWAFGAPLCLAFVALLTLWGRWSRQ